MNIDLIFRDNKTYKKIHGLTVKFRLWHVIMQYNMKDDTQTKIYIVSHKQTDYIHNEIFQPIQVGTSLPGHQKLESFLHDNDGEDNISDRNAMFCELTAQYWAWKNSTAKNIGFFHYRRYLSFNDHLKEQPDVWGSIIEPVLDAGLTEKYGWTEKRINDLVEGYDIILPEARDIRLMPQSGKTAREQYVGSGFLHDKDLDVMLGVLREKYPEYIPYAEQYLNSHQTYLNNMFVMRREIFNNYCEWLFDILFECDRRIDYSDYSIEAIRTPGHLAERLLNIYIAKLKSEDKYRIKELPTVVFLETKPFKQLMPVFSENNNAIVLSANDFYVPYIATVLASIREHASAQQNYDIIIMNKDITENNQKRLREIFKEHKNFSVRFLSLRRFEPRFRRFFLRGHFTVETWFRLLLPDILKEYDKVLYLDADLVVNADVAKLYQTNIDNYLLAACRDADTAGLYNGFEPDKKDYMDKVLKIRQPYDYFQAGVILFNLAKFREQFKVDEILRFAASYKWQLLDQDVLNYFTQGQVKFLDMAWNVMYDWHGIRLKEIIGRGPKYLRDEYVAAHANPKIIHYAGPEKPWNDPRVDYADIFWKYCRQSGFYELAIFNMSQALIVPQNNIRHKIKKLAKKALPEKTRRGRIARSAYEKWRR